MNLAEAEREAMVAKYGNCCQGSDPYCAAGCLVQKAILRDMPRPTTNAEKIWQQCESLDHHGFDMGCRVICIPCIDAELNRLHQLLAQAQAAASEAASLRTRNI